MVVVTAVVTTSGPAFHGHWRYRMTRSSRARHPDHAPALPTARGILLDRQDLRVHSASSVGKVTGFGPGVKDGHPPRIAQQRCGITESPVPASGVKEDLGPCPVASSSATLEV